MPNPNLPSTAEANALVDLNKLDETGQVPPSQQAAIVSRLNVGAEYPSPADIDHWFTYHAPTPDQVVQYQELRDFGHDFALTILRLCPAGADRTTAIRQVREAVFTANAAIACGGR